MIMSMQPSMELGIRIKLYQQPRHQAAALQRLETRDRTPLLGCNLPLNTVQLISTCSSKLTHRKWKQVCGFHNRSHQFRCHYFLNPATSFDANFIKNATLTLARSSYNCLQARPLEMKLAASLGIVIFAIWGLVPLVRLARKMLLHKSGGSWKTSGTYQLTTSCIQPLLLWTGTYLICRSLDPVILPAETAQLVKKRLISFVSSLSTVLAFAYCLSSAIQHAQKFFMETCDLTDTTNMGFHLAGRAVHIAVWIAAATLFMELLGFSTQKWLTAGGLGTVLLTLAGREIFTNFLSSAMLHATRPFVVNEWIQTKIEGYDVSGIVESVGWWAPTIIRGEDREAVHIPNHKFTVNVVRNLSKKKHWRIKTHLCISHLDVSKINNIVADMRKVLSKNPQVEQQKLHRRVFLENIDPENQALMILVSCFVKTSHVEEYLCVKEAVLLDLLRVIRHHRARLATPIRSVQKMYPESDLDSAPFAESVFRRGTVSNGPFLLVEPIHKSNEEKSKSQAQSAQANGDDSKAETKSQDSLVNDSDEGASSDLKSTPSTEQKTHGIQSSDVTTGSEVVTLPDVETKDDQTTSPELEVSNGAKTVPKDTKTDGKTRQVTRETKPSSSQPEARVRKSDNSTSHPSMQENIVLGVALEGSKRTLRIDEATDTPNLEDFKELATLCSGNSPILAEKDRMDKEFE